MAPRPSRPATDRGAGLLSSLFGVVFFLGFLLLATQVTVNLMTASAVVDEAHRSATAIARAAGDAAEVERQRTRLTRRFAPTDPAATVAVDVSDHHVTVTVRLRPSRPLIAPAATTVERRAVVRLERLAGQ